MFLIQYAKALAFSFKKYIFAQINKKIYKTVLQKITNLLLLTGMFLLLQYCTSENTNDGDNTTIDTSWKATNKTTNNSLSSLDKTSSSATTGLDKNNEMQSKKGLDDKQMVYFKGGIITIGSNNRFPNQKPAFEIKVSAFYIDKSPVTVAEFRRFIEATGFVTEADKFGNAGVYHTGQGRWSLVEGANWEYPLGPGHPKAEDNHPVTQVSWNDAIAYSRWAGKRLPTEIEWEYAAKNGKNTDNKYSWGNRIVVNGEYQANIWQGTKNQNTKIDGYLYTSPVGAFGKTPAGLTDIAGNVWEWCSDTYMPYEGSDARFYPNPEVKVIRGGSFMFDDAGEESCTVTFRGHNTRETSLFNIGFRCAKDASAR